MSTTARVTADELLDLPRGSQRYELLAGELITMSPAGWKHGVVAGDLNAILGHFVRQHKLGRIFGAETGFLLERDPDTVRAPDASFIHRDHLPSEDPAEAYWPGSPDLAAEVLSPSESVAGVEKKVKDWFDGGALLVWVVDPEKRNVAVFRSAEDVTMLDEDDELDGGDVVPGFRCRVAEVFSNI